jgi:hypothetical protein
MAVLGLPLHDEHATATRTAALAVEAHRRLDRMAVAPGPLRQRIAQLMEMR